MSARNAEPETVALAVLDACERAVRGVAPNYDDARDQDAQFMKRCVSNIQSRVRTLKRQAAALWKPEFTRVLDAAHSIAVEDVDFDEKEGVRTQKMKCMACGRYEHCCKFGLSAVGPFEDAAFNAASVGEFQPNWREFIKGYELTCGERATDAARVGRLPTQDLGLYTIGTTCLRKAELYYATNTLMLECCYDAYQEYMKGKTDSAEDHGKWFYANDRNVGLFMDKLEQLELAIADEKRPPPSWGSDSVLWSAIELARSTAADGDDERRLELLRARSEQMLARPPRSKERREQESDDDDILELSDDDEDQDYDCGYAAPHYRGAVGGGAKRRVVQSDDEDGLASETCARKQKGVSERLLLKRRASRSPTRRSRRSRGLAPDELDGFEGPSNEGAETEAETETEEDEEAAQEEAAHDASRGTMVMRDVASEGPNERQAEYVTVNVGSRRPAPSANNMAQDHRAPGNRLPARRQALINLGTLQLKLLRERRDDDAAICTAAMFTLQDCLSRIDQLSHTV